MMSAPTSRRNSTGIFVWWLNPSVIVFCFLIPLYLAIWMAGVATDGTISTAKGYFYLHGSFAWLGLMGLIVLGIGTLSPVQPTHVQLNPDQLNNTVLITIGALSLLGYAYWFRELIFNPIRFWEIITGGSITYSLRQTIDRGAGIGSLAQLGLPFAIGYFYRRWNSDASRSTPKVHTYILFCILLATAFRSFAWAERLAVIEMSVAICLVWVSFGGKNAGPAVRTLINLAPFAGAIAVVLLFAAAEYYRSWSSFYSAREDSFWEFIFQRLINYYFNALNTGAGRLATQEWPTYEFAWTLRWVHRLPIIGSIFNYIVGSTPDNFLDRYGDPEFNNPSGLMSIYLDVGVIWALFVFLLLGIAAKYVYSYWRQGKTFIGSLYYLFLMLFLEFFRYFYLGDSRCFMVILGLSALIISAKHIHRAQAKSRLAAGYS